MSSVLSGIYVSLDVLLDTRLGTLAKLGGNELVIKTLMSNYHTRQDDKFKDVDVTAYKRMYANRDVETLSLSTLTQVMPLVRQFTTSLMKQTLNRPFHEGVRIFVNIYPYQLDDEEQQELTQVLAELMAGFSKVDIPLKMEIVSLSDEELTPEYCKTNFSLMLMYDYDNWLSVQQRAILKSPMPEVTLYAPRIYTVQTPTDEQLAELKTQFPWSPFEAIEKSISGGVTLELMPIELFSILKPEELTT